MERKLEHKKLIVLKSNEWIFYRDLVKVFLMEKAFAF